MRGCLVSVLTACLCSCSSLHLHGSGPYENENILMLRSPALEYSANAFDQDEVASRMADASRVQWQAAKVIVKVADEMGRPFESTLDGVFDVYGNAWCRLARPVWYGLANRGGVVECTVQSGSGAWRCRMEISGDAAEWILIGRKWGRTIGIVIDPQWEVTGTR